MVTIVIINNAVFTFGDLVALLEFGAPDGLPVFAHDLGRSEANEYQGGDSDDDKVLEASNDGYEILEQVEGKGEVSQGHWDGHLQYQWDALVPKEAPNQSEILDYIENSAHRLESELLHGASDMTRQTARNHGIEPGEAVSRPVAAMMLKLPSAF